MTTNSAEDKPKRTPLKNLVRRAPTPIRRIAARLWHAARLEWPEPVARAKHIWTSRNPRDYNGKILFKMARDRRPILTIFADKLKARDYVTELIGDDLLIPILDQARSAQDIEWAHLPREYVVKVNHASRGMIIVSRFADPAARLPRPEDDPGWSRNHIHPDSADPAQIAALCDHWLSQRYNWNPGNYREWAYRDIPRRVFVEQHVGDTGGYAHGVKIHCFNGVPASIAFISFTEAAIEDADLRFLVTELEPAARATGLTEATLITLLEQSRTLAAGSDFLRVDWLITPDGPRFNELTNYPGAGVRSPMGLGAATPFSIDDLYANAWALPRTYRWPSRHRVKTPPRLIP